MTADELAIEDEISAVRLDWLDAEARLVELLPPASLPAGSSAPDPDPDRDPAGLTAALEQAERAHHAYMTTIRKWAGLSAN
jgi:hypothetical protein